MTLKNKYTIFYIIFWPFVIISAFILLSNHYYSPDEGIVLNAAWQLWHGKEMYTDFIEYITPGSTYFAYWLWVLSHSTSYAIVKIFSIFFWLISAVGVFLISKKINNKNYLHVFAVFFWLLLSRYYTLINHNYYSSFLAVWLVYFFLVSLEKQKKYLFFITGIMAGGVFLFLQTKGLMLFAIALLIIIFFLKAKNKLMSGFFLGIGFLSITLPLLLFWPAKTLWHSLFLFPWQTQYMNYSVCSPIIVALGVLIILLMLILARQKKQGILWWLLFFQVGLYLSVFNSFERSHLMINSFIFCIFLGSLLENIFNHLKFNHILRYYVLIQLLLVGLAVSLAFIPFHKNNNIYTLDLFHLTRRSVIDIAEIQKAKYIYAGPYLPNFYYELGKENPFPISVAFLCDENCENKVIEKIKEVEPEFALLNYQSAGHFKYNNNSRINSYFTNNYRICYKYQKVTIYAKDQCPKRE
ncbi:MAG: hypothetical protein WC752_00080 [Patescibacteria group bacterium]|jgi:hypothetical protein